MKWSFCWIHLTFFQIGAWSSLSCNNRWFYWGNFKIVKFLHLLGFFHMWYMSHGWYELVMHIVSGMSYWTQKEVKLPNSWPKTHAVEKCFSKNLLYSFEVACCILLCLIKNPWMVEKHIHNDQAVNSSLITHYIAARVNSSFVLFCFVFFQMYPLKPRPSISPNYWDFLPCSRDCEQRLATFAR